MKHVVTTPAYILLKNDFDMGAQKSSVNGPRDELTSLEFKIYQ